MRSRKNNLSGGIRNFKLKCCTGRNDLSVREISNDTYPVICVLFADIVVIIPCKSALIIKHTVCIFELGVICYSYYVRYASRIVVGAFAEICRNCR